MAFTLYAAIVPSQIQILDSIARLVVKAEAFCKDGAISSEELIGSRIVADMLPFSYQVKSTVVHSIGAIDGVRCGSFSPDTSEPPATFGALKSRVDNAIALLRAIDPQEIDDFIGRDMIFQFKDRQMAFFAEDFLLSFSQPNFYFHATTAYDILRMNGLDIGKRDFTGRVRTKPAAAQ